jgi:hypothetical protein
MLGFSINSLFMGQVTWFNICNALIALGALSFSIYNFWYSKFKKAKLTYICNGWTILIASKRDDEGNLDDNSPLFLLNISIRNEGAQAITLKDFILKVTDRNEKVFYFAPISLFDFDYFSSNLGNASPLKAQKGLTPLPLEIPANTTYKFGYCILFGPYDYAIENIMNLDDLPMQVEVLVNDDFQKYKTVSTQTMEEENIKGISQGSFSAIESTPTVEARKKFIETHTKKA